MITVPRSTNWATVSVNWMIIIYNVILVGVVGNISACHADARGSIPRRGVYDFCYCNRPLSLPS